MLKDHCLATSFTVKFFLFFKITCFVSALVDIIAQKTKEKEQVGRDKCQKIDLMEEPTG